MSCPWLLSDVVVSMRIKSVHKPNRKTSLNCLNFLVLSSHDAVAHSSLNEGGCGRGRKDRHVDQREIDTDRQRDKDRSRDIICLSDNRSAVFFFGSNWFA